jgi:non-ribosomal peptide synthetase component F
VHSASELIRAIATLAWPIFALVAVILFRSQLGRILATAGPLRRAKAGPLEVEWERQLAEAEVDIEAAGIAPPTTAPELADDLAAVARTSPTAAIMEAYARVEAELRQLLQGRGLSEVELRSGGARLARMAARLGVISEEAVRAVEGIGVMRNLAAHGQPRAISPDQAIDYLVLADSVLYAIRNPPRER